MRIDVRRPLGSDTATLTRSAGASGYPAGRKSTRPAAYTARGCCSENRIPSATTCNFTTAHRLLIMHSNEPSVTWAVTPAIRRSRSMIAGVTSESGMSATPSPAFATRNIASDIASASTGVSQEYVRCIVANFYDGPTLNVRPAPTAHSFYDRLFRRSVLSRRVVSRHAGAIPAFLNPHVQLFVSRQKK